MKAIIEIEMTNEAFGEVSNPFVELGMIVQGLGYIIEEDEEPKERKLFDSNNEFCGTIKYKE